MCHGSVLPMLLVADNYKGGKNTENLLGSFVLRSHDLKEMLE